jgi:hypothetical protein
MDSRKWSKDRRIGETALRALAKITPDALKTLQDEELEHLILALATVTRACGRETSERALLKKRRRK